MPRHGCGPNTAFCRGTGGRGSVGGRVTFHDPAALPDAPQPPAKDRLVRVAPMPGPRPVASVAVVILRVVLAVHTRPLNLDGPSPVPRHGEAWPHGARDHTLPRTHFVPGAAPSGTTKGTGSNGRMAECGRGGTGDKVCS